MQKNSAEAVALPLGIMGKAGLQVLREASTIVITHWESKRSTMDVEYFREKTMAWLKSFLKDRWVSIGARNKPDLVTLTLKLS